MQRNIWQDGFSCLYAFYEIAEFVFYGLDISFGEILKSNSYIYDDFDYDTVKVKIAVALFAYSSKLCFIEKERQVANYRRGQNILEFVFIFYLERFSQLYMILFQYLVQSTKRLRRSYGIPLLNINYDKECFGIPLNVICVATLCMGI